MTESGAPGLTAREVECLRCVSQHKRTKVIAAELSLAPKTVDAYLSSAARKLGVTDRDSAVRMWMEAAGGASGNSPSGKTRLEDEPGMLFDPGVERPSWPVPTQGVPTNELAIGKRLMWIVVLGALMLTTATLYMLGVRMLAGHL